MKLVQWQGDVGTFDALAAQLKDSMEYMNFTIGIEAAAASFALNERDMELQRTLESLGGVEAVTQDPDKLKMLTSAQLCPSPCIALCWRKLMLHHLSNPAANSCILKCDKLRGRVYRRSISAGLCWERHKVQYCRPLLFLR